MIEYNRSFTGRGEAPGTESYMSIGETVAAVSTPRGRGGVAVIRITGDGAAAVADRAFRPAGGGLLSERPPRTAVFGSVVREDGEVVDRAVAALFRGPRSFTGEDTAEISCHGGVAVTAAALEAVFAAGASPAGPGEFTRRAFINGKISLSEAEAVGLLIDADTEDRMKLAVNSAGGALRRKIEAVGDGLSDAVSELCAIIDFPDELISEDGGTDADGRIVTAVAKAAEDTEKLLSTYRRGAAVADGVRTAILGSPNVGKSSLFNALTGGDDAIVTDIPGTTRDVLRRTVPFGGVTLLLSDTAGLRETDETVERIGVERAKKEAEDAEMIFFVVDGSRPLSEGEKAEISSLPPATRFAAVNKRDLPRGLSAEDETFLKEAFDAVAGISASNGDTEELADAVRDAFDSDRVDLSRDPVIWDARQRADLTAAAALLREAERTLRAGGPPDAACALCEEAAARLRMTDGRGIGEEIVDRIFSRFCVGK